MNPSNKTPIERFGLAWIVTPAVNRVLSQHGKHTLTDGDIFGTLLQVATDSRSMAGAEGRTGRRGMDLKRQWFFVLMDREFDLCVELLGAMRAAITKQSKQAICRRWLTTEGMLHADKSQDQLAALVSERSGIPISSDDIKKAIHDL